MRLFFGEIQKTGKNGKWSLVGREGSVFACRNQTISWPWHATRTVSSQERRRDDQQRTDLRRLPLLGNCWQRLPPRDSREHYANISPTPDSRTSWTFRFWTLFRNDNLSAVNWTINFLVVWRQLQIGSNRRSFFGLLERNRQTKSKSKNIL